MDRVTDRVSSTSYVKTIHSRSDTKGRCPSGLSGRQKCPIKRETRRYTESRHSIGRYLPSLLPRDPYDYIRHCGTRGTEYPYTGT